MKTSRQKRVTKRLSQPKRSRVRFALIERKFPYTRFLEFPQMKGRIIEKIEFATSPEFHCVTIRFQDKTALTLNLNPCFLLTAEFADISRDLRIIKEWPPIHSYIEP